jgi:proteasome alpha subunit
VQAYLKDRINAEAPALKAALSLCHAALEQSTSQKIPSENLEAAVLDRTRSGRKFRRLSVTETRQLLSH